MSFVDQVHIRVKAGKGGDGAIAFRREAHRPLGGPSGGDGGKGGSVIFVAKTRLSTLLDLQYQREIRARDGAKGRGRDQYGKGAPDEIIEVPVGTQIFDAETGELIADLDEPEKSAVVARGGRGGRGNMHFATPEERAPRRAEPGEPGEELDLRLELKLMADVGIVGFPNVGKSTLIASISRARPEIADYPFTTLTPQLGVVSRGPGRSFVVADIPGIIEGAAEGAGLGLRFLRHVERTRLIVHLIAYDPDPKRDPLADFDILRREMERFDPALAEREVFVALGKADLEETALYEEELRKEFESRGYPFFVISGVTGQGIEPLLDALETKLEELKAPIEKDDPPPFSSEDRPHGDLVGFPKPPDEE